MTGALQMVVRKDQIGKEYIYFSVTDEGVLPAGSFRGAFGPNNVFAVRKNFNKIEFITQNTSFYFNPASPLSRAADANISPGVLASIEIAATDTATGEYLIKADDLFLTETLRQVKPSPRPGAPPGAGFTLGSLSKSKTRVESIKSYPLNTDVVVTYVYENPAPTAGGGPEVTDPRNVSVTIQHSFIELPVNDYQPRYADPRVGYFTDDVTDLTSTSVTPWRDMVTRWNLVKQNPGAARSDPVEPITFWIENTTPVELRPAIREGVLRWNEAFETAGFTNAVVVKEQPDTATWDAGDLRYNVLRWTASPTPPFGGYGPSFTNPRTGQILGADIMLEFIFVTNRLLQSELFDVAGQSMALSSDQSATDGCAAQSLMQQQTLLGVAALQLEGASDAEVNAFVQQAVISLVLHEVGHTLGLNHNMKASQMLSPAQLQDSALVASRGVSGSVMDYHAVNLSQPGARKTVPFDTRPGPYDRWAIEFAYRPSLADASAEAARTTALLNRSTEPDLAFGNDADDMRSPSGGIDPRVMVGDLSSDGLTWAAGRFTIDDTLLAHIGGRYPKPGQDYATLRTAYLMVTGDKANAAVVASRYIGGVYVSRAVDGQPGAVGAVHAGAARRAAAGHAAAPDRVLRAGRLERVAGVAGRAPAAPPRLQRPRPAGAARPGAGGAAGGADVPPGAAHPGAAHRFTALRQSVLGGPDDVGPDGRGLCRRRPRQRQHHPAEPAARVRDPAGRHAARAGRRHVRPRLEVRGGGQPEEDPGPGGHAGRGRRDAGAPPARGAGGGAGARPEVLRLEGVLHAEPDLSAPEGGRLELGGEVGRLEG